LASGDFGRERWRACSGPVGGAGGVRSRKVAQEPAAVRAHPTMATKLRPKPERAVCHRRRYEQPSWLFRLMAVPPLADVAGRFEPQQGSAVSIEGQGRAVVGSRSPLLCRGGTRSAAISGVGVTDGVNVAAAIAHAIAGALANRNVLTGSSSH
jgi:hypothetical protein